MSTERIFRKRWLAGLALACSHLMGCSSSDAPAGATATDASSTPSDDGESMTSGFTAEQACALLDEQDVMTELASMDLNKTTNAKDGDAECEYKVGMNGRWVLLHLYATSHRATFPAQPDPEYQGIGDSAFLRLSSALFVLKGDVSFFIEEKEPANLMFLKTEAIKIAAQL